MEESSLKSQRKKILSFERGFMAVHLINLGAKLGIFEVFNENPNGITVAQLASRLELHEPYVKIWCQTAYHYDILNYKEDRFILQPFFNEILGDKPNPNNYLANIELDVEIVGDLLQKAPDYYRSGKIIELEYTPEISQIVYEVTRNTHLAFPYLVLPKNEDLKIMLENGARFLDIGCGNGNLIINLAQSFKNSTFVGIGPDEYGIKESKKSISKFGLNEQIKVFKKSGEELQFNNEFDIICMFFVFHEIFQEVKQTVIERVFQSLKDGGVFLILDLPYPKNIEDFRNKRYAGGIFDQFFEATIGSVHLTDEELNGVLINAGFKDIKRMPIINGMIDLVRAIK